MEKEDLTQILHQWYIKWREDFEEERKIFTWAKDDLRNKIHKHFKIKKEGE